MASLQEGMEPVSEVLNGKSPVYLVNFKEPRGVMAEFLKQEPAQVCDRRKPAKALFISLQLLEEFWVLSTEIRESL